VEDRRKQIIDVGLSLLREEGLSGLTQPRIAMRTGLRQSHLTYYYPTRAALVAAIARAAIDAQAAAARSMAAQITSLKKAAEIIAVGTANHENTRVLVALSQAAEKEPEVRTMFNALADGSIAVVTALLEKLGLQPTTANADLVHAMFIGLSVTQLATGRPNGQARSKAALEAAFNLLASSRVLPEEKRPRRRNRNKA
jgi:DNA-binding transcriptional regulator YbjK